MESQRNRYYILFICFNRNTNNKTGLVVYDEIRRDCIYIYIGRHACDDETKNITGKNIIKNNNNKKMQTSKRQQQRRTFWIIVIIFPNVSLCPHTACRLPHIPPSPDHIDVVGTSRVNIIGFVSDGSGANLLKNTHTFCKGSVV